ncbi:beta-galactosidase GalB [Pontibacter korlensis]|uniref:Glycoside hydrolase n=1 Tax=Pontibacter korlensis TaxID=400092 RepID=A0A0E3UVR7_9BACT|nr:beta-galactosidase GalB [Pontibacter korlensis]AKD02096.1 glycoside hydrolase [Pontibacter korlensis]
MNKSIERVLTYSSKFALILIALVGAYACKSVLNTSEEEKMQVREKSDFNKGWSFHLGDQQNAQDPNFNSSQWRTLNLPHDWSIEGEFSEKHPAGTGGGALPGGIGWYRKAFTVDEADKGKVFYIDFDGVYSNSEVWINGQSLGKRPNGYISFRYDLTPHLKYGNEQNVIAVKVDNAQQPNSRWYSGSGIYRNVWLTKVNPVHVAHWGTYVTTPEVSEQSAKVTISTKVNNRGQQPGTYSLTNIVYDTTGAEVARVTSEDVQLQSVENEINQELTVNNPKLWSVEDPYLYRVVTLVEQKGEVVDNYETPLGIRYFNFDVEKGFTLNGKPMKILGVCNHHDLGALGAAINTRALERQLEIMKGMGVNGIRTAHNPPAPELLELCDKMGFIVMDEVFDMWKKSKSKYDYSLAWDEWHEQDLKDFIRRDRNHPSVFIWSIGNEIPEQWGLEGTPIAKELAGIVKSLDRTRPITAGLNEPYPHNSIYQSGVLDLVGFNYHHQDFEKFPETFPGQKFIATETTSALATRGHYDMPSDSIRRWPYKWDEPFTDGNKDLTVSAYDNVSTPWGSTHEETWKVMKKHDFLSGMFIWTGFDYLGEPTPYGWPARSSYFGVVDLAGFPKDAYYMYKSEWTDEPVLHVFPHWNWEPGKTVDVWAYYNNADEVELFLNGKSLGTKKKEGNDLHVMWRIPYQPGTLKAVSRKGGQEVLTREVKTTGAPAKIVLEADRRNINADGKDLSFVTVKIVDKEGNVVPKADNLVRFNVEGNAFIAGVDNGLQTSMEPFKTNQRAAFNGLALVILQAKEEAGEVKLTATSKGLESESVTITLKE